MSNHARLQLEDPLKGVLMQSKMSPYWTFLCAWTSVCTMFLKMEILLEVLDKDNVSSFVQFQSCCVTHGLSMCAIVLISCYNWINVTCLWTRRILLCLWSPTLMFRVCQHSCSSNVVWLALTCPNLSRPASSVSFLADEYHMCQHRKCKVWHTFGKFPFSPFPLTGGRARACSGGLISKVYLCFLRWCESSIYAVT